jgi:excisionase family DNA binding protein
MARTQRLTSDEIQLAFDDKAMQAQFPPVLSPEQFAQLFGISVSTTYFWISQGLLKGAVTKVGKHRRIWRNRAIEILFNRNQPKEQQNDQCNQ